MKTVAEFIIEEEAGIKDYEEAIAGDPDPRVREVLSKILAEEKNHVEALKALPENTGYKTVPERQNQGRDRYGRTQ